MARQFSADIRIEYPAAGATYSRDEYGAYEYSTYPRSSVLHGQQRRVFLGAYDTLAEAQAAHPSAKLAGGCGYVAPFLRHLDNVEG